MANLVERLELLITANAKDAIAGIKETELAAGNLDKTTSGLSQTMSKLGTYAKVGGGLAAVAITTMAVKGIDDFVNLTASVRQYQRILGGTAEDNSRLAAQLRVLGVDSDLAVKSFGFLAKTIGNGKDTLAQWGTEVSRSKSGNVDLIKTLGNIGDTYKSITSPTDKAAFAAQNFGRGYQAIIPLLSKSREELAAFGKEAEKNHEVFSQEQLDKGRQYQVTLREMKQATQGLALALGEDLVPLVKELTELVTGAIHGVDSLGQSFGYAHLSAVGMGAAIGTIVEPGIGTLIGAGVGLLASMQGGKSATDELRESVAKLVAEYEQTSLGTHGLTQGFEALTKKVLDNSNAVLDNSNNNTHFGVTLGKTLDNTAEGAARITTLTASYAAFKKVAQENLGVAAQIIDSLKAQGVNTTIYEHTLDAIAGKKRTDNKLTDEAAQKNEYLVTTIEDVQNALLKAAGGQLGYEQSLVDVNKAQDDYNQALQEYGDGAPAVYEADLKLRQAKLDLAKATISLGDANDDLAARFNGNRQAAEDEITRLHVLQYTYPQAAASIQPLIDRVQTYVDTINSVPGSKLTDLYLNISAQTGLSVADLRYLDSIPTASFAGGGVVPGPLGAPMPAIVHGGERIYDPLNPDPSMGGWSVNIGTIVAPAPVEAANEIVQRLRAESFLAGMN